MNRMNEAKKYIDAMDRIDAQLNEEDKLYFHNLKEYMMTNTYAIDKESMYEQIYQMYLDFMNAKDDGFSAVDFFGNNPKEMADQIIKELPKATLINISKPIGILAIVLWGIRLFYDFMYNLQITINPVVYLFDLVLSLSLIFILFKIINNSIFRNTKLSDMNVMDALFVIGLLLFYMALYFKVPNLISNSFEIVIPNPWDIVLIISYILVSAIIMWLVKIKEFTDTIIWFILFALIGIELRLNMYTNYDTPFWPRLIIGGILLSVLFSRRKKRRTT